MVALNLPTSCTRNELAKVVKSDKVCMTVSKLSTVLSFIAGLVGIFPLLLPAAHLLVWSVHSHLPSGYAPVLPSYGQELEQN